MYIFLKSSYNVYNIVHLSSCHSNFNSRSASLWYVANAIQIWTHELKNKPILHFWIWTYSKFCIKNAFRIRQAIYVNRLLCLNKHCYKWQNALNVKWITFMFQICCHIQYIWCFPISSHKAYIVKASQNIHIEMCHTNC